MLINNNNEYILSSGKLLHMLLSGYQLLKPHITDTFLYHITLEAHGEVSLMGSENRSFNVHVGV